MRHRLEQRSVGEKRRSNEERSGLEDKQILRERESEGEGEGEGECVCVCERERECEREGESE